MHPIAVTEPERSITRAAPDGVEVRRDGESVELRFKGPADPAGSAFAPAVAIVAGAAIAIALVAAVLGTSGALDVVKAFGVFFTLAVFEWKVRRRGLAGRLAIRGDVLHPGDGASLPLQRVRRIDVVAQNEGHAVRVTTADGEHVVARAKLPADARFIADEVDVAYRAYLRRR